MSFFFFFKLGHSETYRENISMSPLNIPRHGEPFLYINIINRKLFTNMGLQIHK